MRVEMAGVGVEIDDAVIVSDVSLSVEPGELVGLLGPNGGGKSTLLRTVYRALRPRAGAVLIGGDDAWRDLSARAAARRTAAVVQEGSGEFDLAVADVVLLGRAPHQRKLAPASRADREIVRSSLARVGAGGLAHRRFATLSGGEKQRVLLARALAQRSQVLVLDEPTNHLDVSAQLELLELVRDLGITTIAALHDLNLAAGYCDRVVVLARGRVVAAGRVTEVLTPQLLAEVFGVAAHCSVHPLTGLPHLAFAPLNAASSADLSADLLGLDNDETKR